MKSRHPNWFSIWLLYATLLLGPATAAEVAGVSVEFVDYLGPAELSVKLTSKHELRIDVDPRSEPEAMTVKVELPLAGPNAWPVLDVAVLDSKMRAVPVRRGGIEWNKLFITVPPERRTTVVVHVVEPARDRPAVRPEKARYTADLKTGLSATICKWFDGRRAALSIRFDDSHPTHLSKAIPILNEYGFRGTFMVNPAGHPPNSRRRSAFEDHRAEWAAVASRGNHEFANHTMNHRGALNDESMDHEIGAAAEAIWKLFPQRSKLAALNLGGGTQWVTTKPLRYYLDKYHLFDASANSTGMDDVYGNRVATFRRLLESHIERGLWFKVHFHYIGDELSTSESNFRAALDIAQEHQGTLWIAGMADIHKYETERRGAQLEIENKSESRANLRFTCATDLQLYDQPLTIDVTIPQSWEPKNVVIKNQNGKVVRSRVISKSDGGVLRFDVTPTDAQFSIENRRCKE